MWESFFMRGLACAICFTERQNSGSSGAHSVKGDYFSYQQQYVIIRPVRLRWNYLLHSQIWFDKTLILYWRKEHQVRCNYSVSGYMCRRFVVWSEYQTRRNIPHFNFYLRDIEITFANTIKWIEEQHFRSKPISSLTLVKPGLSIATSVVVVWLCKSNWRALYGISKLLYP